MDLVQLAERIADIEAQAGADLKAVAAIDALRGLEANVLGKQGSLGSLIASVKEFPPDQRGQVGKLLNEGKSRIKSLLDARMAELQTVAQADKADDAAAFDP
ncbi:MAG: hypothetical protein AAB363_08170, partial [Planctomycetota bacterium]